MIRVNHTGTETGRLHREPRTLEEAAAENYRTARIRLRWARRWLNAAEFASDLPRGRGANRCSPKATFLSYAANDLLEAAWWRDMARYNRRMASKTA